MRAFSTGQSHVRARLGLLAAAVTAAAVLVAPAVPAAAAVPGGYAPDLEYGRGSLVVGSDGNVYRALDVVKGRDPVAAKDAAWQLADAAFDMTLDVPGRFDSIEKAVGFISGATISDTATCRRSTRPADKSRRPTSTASPRRAWCSMARITWARSAAQSARHPGT